MNPQLVVIYSFLSFLHLGSAIVSSFWVHVGIMPMEGDGVAVDVTLYTLNL